MNWIKYSGNNNINIKLLKHRKEFSHSIETALWLASKTHTQTDRSYGIRNLRFLYRTLLLAVVTAITTRRITPELILVSSLKKVWILTIRCLKTILWLLTLGRIHQNINSSNNSQMIFVFFPTSLAKIFRQYKPFILPNTIAKTQ